MTSSRVPHRHESRTRRLWLEDLIHTCGRAVLLIVLASPFSPAASAQDPVPASVYLKTYTRTGLSDSQSTTWQDFGTQGNYYSFADQTINTSWVWDYVNGGTNCSNQNMHNESSSTDSGGNQTGQTSDSYWGFGTLWSAAIQPGVTTWTNAFSWDGDPSYNFTNICVTDTNVGMPGFAWQKAGFSIIDGATNINSDDFGTYTNIWTATTTENITTTVELFTGGYPGSTDACVATVYAWAYDLIGNTYIDPTQIQIMGTNLNADGTLTMQLTQNSFYDVTPVFPTNYSNVVFGVWADDPPLMIKRGTNNIGGTNVVVIVGEPINLTLDGLSGMSNIVINWTMPSSNVIVGGYAPTAQLGQPIPFTNFHTSDILFYFYDNAGGPFNVRCVASGTQNGSSVNLTNSTTFNVLKPSASWRGTTPGTIGVGTDYWKDGQQVTSTHLHFGQANPTNTNSVGFRFVLDNVNMNGWQGAYKFLSVQTGTWQMKYNLTNGLSYTLTGTGLDTSFPYKEFTQSPDQANDTPGTDSVLRSSQGNVYPAAQFKLDMTCEMVLMFQPTFASSIPVPIKLVRWNGIGVATNNATATGVWGLATTNTKPNIISNDFTTKTFPVWTKLMDNLQVTSTNQWQTLY